MAYFVDRRLLLVLFASVVGVFWSARLVKAITIRTVALSGQSAPGTDDGAIFAGFNRPVVERGGKVAFAAHLTGPNGEERGIWSEGRGSLALVMRQGLAAPGTEVRFSGFFSNPLIIDGGQTAFMAVLQCCVVSASTIQTKSDSGPMRQEACSLLREMVRRRQRLTTACSFLN